MDEDSLGLIVGCSFYGTRALEVFKGNGFVAPVSVLASHSEPRLPPPIMKGLVGMSTHKPKISNRNKLNHLSPTL